jgi:hypothetical protein
MCRGAEKSLYHVTYFLLYASNSTLYKINHCTVYVQYTVLHIFIQGNFHFVQYNEKGLCNKMTYFL